MMEAKHRMSESLSNAAAPLTRPEFLAARVLFLERIAAERLETELTRYLWYHTIDLGAGLVTPGLFDFRDAWPAYGLPEER